MAGRGTGARWETLTAIGAAIAAEPDASAAIAVAARRLAGLCDAAVAIWATGERSEAPRLLAGHPLDRATELDPSALSTLSRAVAGQEPLTAAGAGGAAYLAVPLPARGRIWGVALASAARPEEELAVSRQPVEALAPLLGLLLHDRVREAAARAAGYPAGGEDWRQLRVTIEREVARARRNRSTCAVILVDLDPVETARDDGGPTLDEDALRALITLLRAACRDMDVVDRFGEEQFLVLLPGSDGRGARLVADRFLRQLYLSPVALPPDRSGYLQATIGIAAFPVDGFTADELLANASTELFEARLSVGGR